MKQSLILKSNRWSVLAVVMAGSWRLGLAAQGPEPARTNALTLPEAVRLALANNPELRASQALVEAASGRAYQARKWTNPELEINADEWPVSQGRDFSEAIQTIGLAQTLPYPGKKSLDKQIGGAGVKLSEAELALRRTELVRDVKAGFFRVLASERLVEVSTQLVVDTQRTTAEVRLAYQQELLELNVAQAELEALLQPETTRATTTN